MYKHFISFYVKVDEMFLPSTGGHKLAQNDSLQEAPRLSGIRHLILATEPGDMHCYPQGKNTSKLVQL
jgi:hypothetical protein